MEPTKVKITLRWVVETTVRAYFESFVEPTGWYVWFEGSRESLFLGKEKSDIAIGDKFKITFEKVQT